MTLASLIYLAAAAGIADILVKRARWTEETVITPAVWADTRDTLLWALHLEPHNPNILEKLGKVYYWQSTNGAPNVAAQRAARRHALTYFLQAAQRRPLSAYLWLNVVTLKYLLGEFDEQLTTALDLASRTQPWESAIQRLIVDIGLAAWYRLSEKGHSTILATLKRGMQKQPRELTALVRKYERESVLCIDSEYLTYFTFCAVK